MDNQAARRILELYRPGLDDDDPQFAEALALARRDPQLGRWLDEHKALFGAIRDRLKAAEVPADLKQRILERAPASKRSWIWWRGPAIALAVATVLVVALVGFWSRSRENMSFAAYREEMVAFVSEDYPLDLRSESFEELRRVLLANHFPSFTSLPPAMASLELEGGCRRKWGGHEVALICTEASEHHDVWLFLVERSAVPDAPPGDAPQIVKVGRMMTAAWNEGPLLYLLVVEGDEETLRRYMQPEV